MRSGVDCQLEVFRNGREAFAGLGTQSSVIPALVVVDAELPDMDGLAVVQMLRIDERMRGIPVVVFSDSAQFDIGDDFYAAGATAFHLKSPDGETYKAQVQAVVREWVRAEHLLGRVERPPVAGE